MNNPQFLNEDGVVINNFDLNELGTVKLLRLLKVIENMRPEISSAPVSLVMSLLFYCVLDVVPLVRINAALFRRFRCVRVCQSAVMLQSEF